MKIWKDWVYVKACLRIIIFFFIIIIIIFWLHPVLVVACGILVPQPGIKPMSPALGGGFLTTGPPGKPSDHF